MRIIVSSVEKFKLAIDSPRLTIAAITPKPRERYLAFLIYDLGLRGETAPN